MFFQVQSTLTDLKLAIDGTIVMSQNLRTALNAMYDARIPDRWEKVQVKYNSLVGFNFKIITHLRYPGSLLR